MREKRNEMSDSPRFCAEDAIPWIVSIALHGALIASGFFIVWSVAHLAEESGPPATVSFDAPAPAPRPSEAIESSEVKSVEAPPEEQTPELELDDVLASIGSLSDSLDDLALETPPLSMEIRAMDTEHARVDFAGVGASDARDIVYVVDASGSMISTLVDVMRELKRSIEALHPMQRFQVLLIRNAEGRAFIAPKIPTSARRPVLIDATRRNKEAVSRWLDGVTPAGLSDPLGALESAIRMKPDAIFLLSTDLRGVDDEDLSPVRVLGRLDSLNPRNRRGDRRIVIKTIQILNQDSSGLMERIGLAHGGKDGYKFISLEEFNESQ